MLRRVGIRAAAALVATTATAAATTAVAEPASPSPLRAKTPADSPFSYRELDEAVARRRDQERALATYINTVAPMIASARGEMARAQKLGDAAALARARARFATLAARAQAETAALTWGSPDGQQRRAEFVERFGCVGWTDAALAEIAKHSPIVEMGAGKGQWQRALTERGADVLAYDDRSAVPGTNEPEPWTFFSRKKAPGLKKKNSSRDFFGVVRRGDERKLRSFWVRRADRTLLVVYPEGDLLVKCLQNYDGAVVLFVGEGRGELSGRLGRAQRRGHGRELGGRREHRDHPGGRRRHLRQARRRRRGSERRLREHPDEKFRLAVGPLRVRRRSTEMSRRRQQVQAHPVRRGRLVGLHRVPRRVRHRGGRVAHRGRAL